MKQLVPVAATRPLVSLALGYAPFLVVLGALVVLQSGWREAGVIVGIDAALVLVPLGCVWLGHRALARGRAWWQDRLLGLAGGLAALFLVVMVGALVWEVPPVIPGLKIPSWTVIPALVLLVNLPPLLLGVAIEAVARRLAPRFAVSSAEA